MQSSPKRYSSPEKKIFIDETCRRLFAESQSTVDPIYYWLRIDLIAMYTASFRPPLEVRILPFVLALVVTVEHRDISRNEDLASLVNLTIKTTKDFPSLCQLYPNLSMQNISPPVKKYLTEFMTNMNQHKIKLEDKKILSKNIEVSFIPPSTNTIRDPDTLCHSITLT